MAEAAARVVRFEEDVSFLVEEIFRETFNAPPPRTPVHYVAFVQTGPYSFDVAGYYHVAHFPDYALVGGLCVPERYRRRGIGEQMELLSLANPGTAKAYFAHVGDPRRAKQRGYEPTSKPYVVVNWLQPVDPAEQERLIEEVAALGQF